MTLFRRLSLLALGGVVIAVGLGLIAVSLVGMLSGTSASEQPATSLRFSSEPDHIFDRAVVTPTPTPAPTATPEPTPEPTEAPPVAPPLGDSGFQVVIPRLGIDAPVNTYGLDAQSVPEVPFNGWEVAWYNWSAQPGTGSNSVLAGHVTWGGAAVFYNLNQLSSGDEIVLRGHDGAEIRYTVEANYLVDPDDPDSVSVMMPTEDDTLTVITCGGDYFYTGGPLGGDYTNRRIVRATLNEVTPAPAVAAY